MGPSLVRESTLKKQGVCTGVSCRPFKNNFAEAEWEFQPQMAEAPTPHPAEMAKLPWQGRTTLQLGSRSEMFMKGHILRSQGLELRVSTRSWVQDLGQSQGPQG